MKVSELRALLAEQEGDRIVVVSGYEGGVSEVSAITPCNIRMNVNTEWYYGAHETVDEETPDTVKALGIR